VDAPVLIFGRARTNMGSNAGRDLVVAVDSWCEDRIGTGPPRARTEVIYVDLGYWAISGSIHPKGDPASWGINSSVFRLGGIDAPVLIWEATPDVTLVLRSALLLLYSRYRS